MRKITFLFLTTMILTLFSWQASAQYCTPLVTNCSFESITNVTFGDINNSTACNIYSDYTAQSTTVNPGGTQSISISILTDVQDYLYVFVDWNQNDVLNDAGEVYTVVANTSTDGTYTTNISVPGGATLGATRMRVLVGYTASTPNPCAIPLQFGARWGEVEDYTVNVSNIVGDPPVIVCPGDIIANNEAGTCGAIANYSALAIDTEDGIITGDIVSTHPSGSTFPVGVTNVTLSVTDSDGNTSSCNFNVTVLDNEAPVAVCQDITVEVDPVTGIANITAADLDNGSTDNCGIASMTLDVSSFDCSMTGANTVTITVTDNSGNTATCTSTVTVEDNTAPVITCIGGFGTFTETEDFEGASVPAGWSTVVETGSADWTFGSNVMPLGPNFATNAAIFDDDAAGSGEVNLVRLLSPVYDLTGASNAQLSFEYAIQDFIGSGSLEAEVWDGSAWQQVLFIDDMDVEPINTGDIDVSAFANPAFQVRFTYDDEGDWAWGAGIDNFLLSYEASTGGGLDVFLDANGMASIDPMDLLVNVDEACGYTITAGGVGGGTMGSLTTVFDTNNGGSPGWAVMYDLTVGPNDIAVTDFDVNTDATGPFNLDLYTLVGTYVGNETNAAAWGSPVASGSGTAMGTNQPSNAVLGTPVVFSANTTYGIAIVMDVDVNYSGTGSNPAPGQLNYSNADLSLDLGTAVSGLFTGSVFFPRIWNGTINYTVSGGSGLDFTCADLGENQVEVTVTDDSGNESTCIAIVNVIDLISPVITCGPEPTISETVSDSPALAISDNDPAGVSTTISVTEDVTIEDLDLNLDVTHTWVGDLIVTLTSPTGTSAVLIDRIGTTTGGVGCSGDDILATLDDAAALPVEGQCGGGVPSIDGTFSPNNPLAAFNGESTLGDWTITISDNAGGDTGTLNTWGITYSYANTSTDVVIELGPDGTATIDPFDIISNVDEACGIDTAAVDIPTVSCADIGTTILVTAFVSDTSGNIASCSANITVVDLLAPEITCPADQTVDPGQGNLFYIVPDYFATGEATADDNCTEPVTITTQDPAPGTAIPDGTYTITMTATDEYGNTSTCDFELTVDTVVGVDENSLDAGLALYPNPASTVVNLVNKTNISLEKMMIYDINGKLVNQTNLRTMQGQKAVDVSSLASGIYVVQIIGDNASTVKRLIKE